MRERRALSLGEVLLVACFAILFAVILYVLFGRAHRQGLEQGEAFVLHANATAAILYCKDNDDTFGLSMYTKDRPDGELIAPAKVYSIYDALQPYSGSKEILNVQDSPDPIHWQIVLRRSGFSSAGSLDEVTLAFNFALFEHPRRDGTADSAARKASTLPSPSATPMFFDGRYVPGGEVNRDAPEGSPYRKPAGMLTPQNFPASSRDLGTNVNFADGSVHLLGRYAKLNGAGQDYLSPSRDKVDCFHLPYDLNGIPGVVGEPQR